MKNQRRPLVSLSLLRDTESVLIMQSRRFTSITFLEVLLVVVYLVPVSKINSRFVACDIWNANKKLGQATAYDAIDRAIELADKYGIGQVSVDNAFHYLWGGGYVMEAAKRQWLHSLYKLHFCSC